MKEELLPEVDDVLGNLGSPSHATPLTLLPEDFADIMGGQDFQSRHAHTAIVTRMNML